MFFSFSTYAFSRRIRELLTTTSVFHVRFRDAFCLLLTLRGFLSHRARVFFLVRIGVRLNGTELVRLAFSDGLRDASAAFDEAWGTVLMSLMVVVASLSLALIASIVYDCWKMNLGWFLNTVYAKLYGQKS